LAPSGRRASIDRCRFPLAIESVVAVRKPGGDKGSLLEEPALNGRLPLFLAIKTMDSWKRTNGSAEGVCSMGEVSEN
jgi:hypothetical protein